MSHGLKMAELWQPGHPQNDTVEGWMPPVNIYLFCESVSVCSTAWRQELLWVFICGMTRQPVIYEHLVLLFKHSLISRQTFPEARAEREWPRPDKTSHPLFASHPTCESSIGRTGWEWPVKAHTGVYSVRSKSASRTAERNSATLQWWNSSALRFSSISLIKLRVNGAALNTNKYNLSSSTDVSISVETPTKHPSLMCLFGVIIFTSTWT